MAASPVYTSLKYVHHSTAESLCGRRAIAGTAEEYCQPLHPVVSLRSVSLLCATNAVPLCATNIQKRTECHSTRALQVHLEGARVPGDELMRDERTWVPGRAAHCTRQRGRSLITCPAGSSIASNSASRSASASTASCQQEEAAGMRQSPRNRERQNAFFWVIIPTRHKWLPWGTGCPGRLTPIYRHDFLIAWRGAQSVGQRASLYLETLCLSSEANRLPDLF